MALRGSIQNLIIIIPAGDGAASEAHKVEGLVFPAFQFPIDWENDATLIPLAAMNPEGPFSPMGDDYGAAILLVPGIGSSVGGEGYFMRCEERLFQHVRYVKFRASSAQSEDRTVIAQAVSLDSLVAAQQ